MIKWSIWIPNQLFLRTQLLVLGKDLLNPHDMPHSIQGTEDG